MLRLLLALLLTAPAWADDPDPENPPSSAIHAEHAQPQDATSGAFQLHPHPLGRPHSSSTQEDVNALSGGGGGGGGPAVEEVPDALKNTKWATFKSYDALRQLHPGYNHALAPLVTPGMGYAVGFNTGSPRGHSVRCVIAGGAMSGDGATWHAWISEMNSDKPIAGCHKTAGSGTDRVDTINIYLPGHLMHDKGGKKKGRPMCKLEAEHNYYCRFTATFDVPGANATAFYADTGLQPTK